jgi:type II secretion system protein J
MNLPTTIRKPEPRRPASGFTLVEVLLALAICAIVLVAINAVFATAVRLRDRTSSAVANEVPIEKALANVERDLKGAVGPGGFLAGDFKCDVQGLGANMGITAQAAGGSGLDFFTASGVIGDDAPWGDLQEVFYQLSAPTDAHENGLDLVRYVNRNLLSTTLVTPDAEVLMHHVATIQFDCYDGVQWRTFWDTSSGDTNLPVAVRVQLHMAAQGNEDVPQQQPIEITVPLMTTTRTNMTAAQ